jgi:mono/diheme cytochrome c family protein
VAGLTGVTLLLAACERSTDAPPPPDPDMVALGRRVYQQNCASCHGARGEGTANWEVPDAAGELPPPPHDPTGHTWKHSDRMLYHIVLQGWRDPFNRTDRLTMPAFQDILSPMEIRAVITYLKTLWTPEQQQFQWQESQDEPFTDSAA